MGRLATAYVNNVLDMAFSKATNGFPTTFYIGLSTSEPTDVGGSVTEPVGGSYARVAVTNNATNWPAASARSKSNGTLIAFPTATGSWGFVTHYIIMDAASGGNFVGWGELAVPVNVITGANVSFPIGELIVNAPGS